MGRRVADPEHSVPWYWCRIVPLVKDNRKPLENFEQMRNIA